MSKVSHKGRKQYVQTKDLNQADQSEEIAADVRSSKPPRSRRRSRAERGLPSKKRLVELAKAYLTIQKRRWPGLRSSDAMPRPTESNLTRMATEFRTRFLDKDAIATVFAAAGANDFGIFTCGILLTNPTHGL